MTKLPLQCQVLVRLSTSASKPAAPLLKGSIFVSCCRIGLAGKSVRGIQSYRIVTHTYSQVYDVRFELPAIAAMSMMTPTRPDAPSARNTPLSAAASSRVGRPLAEKVCLPSPLDAIQGAEPVFRKPSCREFGRVLVDCEVAPDPDGR